MTILLTGAAGFIGARVAHVLLGRGETVIGLDSVNDYYDPALKKARLAALDGHPDWSFVRGDVADEGVLDALPDGITAVIHLAAQAGVRYSIEEPFAYAHANLTGQTRLLEFARQRSVTHTVYASSSSVYGGNTDTPFSEDDRTDDPVSFYGATKKSGELLAQSYARLYGLKLTGLRFFTVYGPLGRPDMAYYIFAEAIRKGRPIRLFNEGRMGRDFTYVDDIADGVVRALDRPDRDDPAPHRLYNLGNDQPQELLTMVQLLEGALGAKAEKIMAPMQPGDVVRTWANIDRARTELGYAPKVSLADGLDRFAGWYRDWTGWSS